MKILTTEPITAHSVVTDDKDYPKHTRYSPSSWTISMGESEEVVYDCEELEAEFQRFIASKLKRDQ